MEAWLRSSFVTDDTAAIDLVIEPMKEARRERQGPAHGFSADEYGLSYWARQDDLMKRAYVSMRALRLILANYPGAETVAVPEWLQAGRIRLH